MSDTYKGRVSVSREKTIKAWKLEYIDGLTRIAVAFKMNVEERTISRMYKHYGLPSPKRRKNSAESLSVLQECTPDRVHMPEKAFTEKE